MGMYIAVGVLADPYLWADEEGVEQWLEEFESLRSLRREKRVQVWAGSILRAVRHESPPRSMDAGAWRIVCGCGATSCQFRITRLPG